MIATTDRLLDYLADLVERIERYGAMVLQTNDDELGWGNDDRGDLLMDVRARPPLTVRSRSVQLTFQERWEPVGRDTWFRREYSYELRDHVRDYRRAFHRHDEARFVRTFDVVTHEHCEAPMGRAACAHYYCAPVASAMDALERLYDVWLTGAIPDCSALRCLD